MKIALYLRVSTRDKQDISKQRDVLIDFAKRQEWEIQDVYGDIGVSGQKSSRPELDRMLSQIDDWDGVLVYKLDRIGRSLKHLLELMELFNKKEKMFVSVTQSIDTSKPEGRLFFHMLAIFAEFEREIIRQRVVDGLAVARARGYKPGRKKGQKDLRPRQKVGYYLRWQKERKNRLLRAPAKSELEKQQKKAGIIQQKNHPNGQGVL